MVRVRVESCKAFYVLASYFDKGENVKTAGFPSNLLFVYAGEIVLRSEVIRMSARKRTMKSSIRVVATAGRPAPIFFLTLYILGPYSGGENNFPDSYI